MDSMLLLRYVSGDASAEEAAAVDAWRAEDPAHERELRLLAAAWAQTMAPAGGSPSPASWQRIARRTQRPRTPLARAAAIILVAGAAGAVAVLRPRAAPESAHIYATTAGDTLAVTLHDGSRVVLGPASELRVDRAGGRTRSVSLAGTAFFEVSHAAGTPFVVATDGVETTVLGTAFIVRAYPGDVTIDVAVVEGRVAVSRAGSADGRALLGPGQRATVPQQDGAVSVTRDDGATLLAWRNGMLLFRDMRVDAVARELERWFDIDVAVPDPAIAQRRLTLSARTSSLDEVLTLMEASLGVRVERAGRTITISRAGQ